MKWTTLLSVDRFGHDGEPIAGDEDPHRSQYQRDYDRILLTSSFRRLRDKTQMFALSDNDHVHSRLSHSLVVSSIGRSLGNAAGKYVLSRYEKEFAVQRKKDNRSVESFDFGDIVAAACLAHDIGNPPFGHSGEDAMAEFFEKYFNSVDSPNLGEKERYDFEHFEGNAQGFRILTRLENQASGGLQLTAATLATFTKYPREAGEIGKGIPDMGVASKKHGFMQSERQIFEAVAKAVGLEKATGDGEHLAFCRHPLSYLVEAADDITYRIFDVEDGLHLKIIPQKDAIDCLEGIASRKKNYRRPKRKLYDDNLTYLRGLAISQLREEVVTVFKDYHNDILGGIYKDSLFDEIQSHEDIKRLKKLMDDHCYKHSSVIQIELAGYKVLGGLLKRMIDAVTSKAPTKRQQHVMALIKLNERPCGSIYKRLSSVADYVSGMTDRYALNLYRKLRGVSLPSNSP